MGSLPITNIRGGLWIPQKPVSRKRELEEHGATVSNFTEGFQPTTGVGQQRHAVRRRAARRELLRRDIHSRGGHEVSDRAV